MLRLFLLLGIVTTTLASVTLDALDSAAQSFSTAIDQQWRIARSDPSPATLAQNTLSYATAKISYYSALRAAMPELANIATGRKFQPPGVDKFCDTFGPAGELREIAAEKATAALLQRYGAEPDIQKASAEFDQAHEIEERFVKDFEGQDFALGKRGSCRGLMGTLRFGNLIQSEKE
jgi:hypothetical protein